MKLRPTIILVLGSLWMVGCGGNSGPVVDFTAAPLQDGPDIQLSVDYKDKPVVVYMWATWCGPCKQFAPTLNQMATRYKGKGIEFLAISGESKSLIRESEKKEPHNMTVLVDTISSATEAVGGSALPTIVVLNKEHKPIWASRGFGATTESEMITALDSL